MIEHLRPTTLLLAATRPELVPTVERLGLRWRDKCEAEGTAARRRVVARVTGVGAARALGALERVRGEHALRQVISLGFAGGLAPRWRGGETAYVRRVVNAAGEAIDLDTPGQGEAVVLLTLDHMVADVAEKRRLYEQSGAEMVDMETYALAKRVGELVTDGEDRVAFVALRAISDPADVALPVEMVDWVDAEGRPRATAAMAWLARNPFRLPMLRQLQRDTGRGAEALARAVAKRLQAEDGPARD